MRLNFFVIHTVKQPLPTDLLLHKNVQKYSVFFPPLGNPNIDFQFSSFSFGDILLELKAMSSASRRVVVEGSFVKHVLKRSTCSPTEM